MPRQKSHSQKTLILDAMNYFWTYGYEATSMRDLVAATGVSRHGIYELFDGKHALFMACLEAYQHEVVSPAFSYVEREDASFDDVEHYFMQQIDRAETLGLPGPGCFVANTMTEVSPHDTQVAALTLLHNTRLKNGFGNVFKNTLPLEFPKKEIDLLTEFMLINTQGLWSFSRSVSSAAPLRQYVKTLISVIKGKIHNA